MDVTVIITTFGAAWWEQLAMDRAYPSAIAQTMTVTYHTDECVSLGDARNQAVDQYDPQGWLCFLDADDELAPYYMAAMSKVEAPAETDLLVPAHKQGQNPPTLYHRRDIMKMNPCPIGTLIHRSMFEDAGRFWDEPAWEDWSLFRRAVLLGATLRWVPDAVYIDNATGSGRNSSVRNGRHLRNQIIQSHKNWMASR